MVNEKISSKLKELRKQRAFTQHTIETLTGIDRTTISAYENGIREPSIKNLIILSNLYKVSLDYLCGRTNRKIIDITDEDEITQQQIIALLYENIHKRYNKS